MANIQKLFLPHGGYHKLLSNKVAVSAKTYTASASSKLENEFRDVSLGTD